METTFAGRCVRHFLSLRGLDRAVVISSQAFTAVIPLLLLVSSLAPVDHRDVISTALIRRFELNGDSADAVSQLFAHSGDGTTSTLSVLILVFSGVSLTRRLQGMYQEAWRLDPAPGMGRALSALLGLSALVLGISLLYLARSILVWLSLGIILVTPLSVLASFVLWTTVPWLLLGRRLTWRRLIPAGALTATCTGIYGIATTVYMPRLLESYSERYGLFGVTLALIGWLLCIAVIVVAATAIAAEFDRDPAAWARRVRRGLRIEASLTDIPREAVVVTVPEPSQRTR